MPFFPSPTLPGPPWQLNVSEYIIANTKPPCDTERERERGMEVFLTIGMTSEEFSELFLF